MNRNGLLLWVLGGIGVLLTYAAVKNATPQSVLATQLGVGAGRVAINPTAAALPATGTSTPASGTTDIYTPNGLSTSVPNAYATSPNTYKQYGGANGKGISGGGGGGGGGGGI